MGILEQLSDKIDRMNARLIEMDILLIKLSEQKEQPQDRQNKEKRIKESMICKDDAEAESKGFQTDNRSQLG